MNAQPNGNGHLEPIGPIAKTALEQHVRQRAQALLIRAQGIREGGAPQLAEDSAFIAQRLLETMDELDAERSARIAIQARNDRLENIIGKAAYNACAK